MTDHRKFGRRHFLGIAAMTVAASEWTGLSFANIVKSKKSLTPIDTFENQSNEPFDAIKQIKAGDLNVGYAESGPEGGPPVLLLHGWPYDIHSFADVAPLLAEKGYRVIVPHLRG